MDTLRQYLATVPNEEHRESLESLIEWVTNSFPELQLAIKGNVAMMGNNGTFFIGLSAAAHYVSMAPETKVLYEFVELIKEAGYGHAKMKFQIKGNQKNDYELLRDSIERSIDFKKGSKT